VSSDLDGRTVLLVLLGAVVVLPEGRGILLGGLLGGVLGAALLLGMDLDLFWVPRLSPLLTADTLTLLSFGFGIGAAVGGFGGGVWGTLQDLPETADERVAVDVTDARAGEVTSKLRSNGAVVVDDVNTGTRPPRRE